jgi:hypothetical protein
VEPDNESVLRTVRRAGLDGVPAYVDGVLEIEVVLPVDAVDGTGTELQLPA